MKDDREPLELIATLARCASGMDPKSPKGTKPGLTLSDIAGALGMVGDSMGADMAIAIATLDFRKRDAIEGHLEMYVMEEARRGGYQPRWETVYPAVAEAFEDVMAGRSKREGRTVSRYYRWAYAEFIGRAQNAAIVACRRLFRTAS